MKPGMRFEFSDVEKREVRSRRKAGQTLHKARGCSESDDTLRHYMSFSLGLLDGRCCVRQAERHLLMIEVTGSSAESRVFGQKTGARDFENGPLLCLCECQNTPRRY